MLQIGSVVDRKYKILSEVGHGGMSVVYLAINERANKTWAVKEVRKDGTCNFEAVKQGLVVETDMLKRLNHPYLPSIIDVIDTEDSFLIVMDYIEGRSLQEILKKSGAQNQDTVIEWGKQLCDVLGYLHTQQPAIIYRDMKPANVMLKPDGTVTLIDFGTAREFKNREMVEDTTCLGTRGYAAPEQFGGRGQTDARTDIYCLGATLYHLLTGHSPAEPPYEIKPLRYWSPMFEGSGIEKVIAKCCQQDPEERYQTCEELAYALEHVHDEDDAARAVRKRKWSAFIASVAVFAVGIIGMIGFYAAKNNAKQKTYDYYVADATTVSDYTEAAQYYQKAIDLDPSKADAYEEMVSRIQILDPNSEGALLGCLYESNGGTKRNIEYLRDADRAAYDELEFEIGYRFFFQYDNTPGHIKQSASYFNEALSGGTLDQNKTALVQSLYTIANSYEQLSASTENVFVQNSYTFKDLWSDLNSIVDGDVREKLGDNLYCIALYKHLANQINIHSMDFKNNGIEKAKMEAQLSKAEQVLGELDITSAEQSRGIEQLKDDALNEIEKAYQALAAAFND